MESAIERRHFFLTFGLCAEPNGPKYTWATHYVIVRWANDASEAIAIAENAVFQTPWTPDRWCPGSHDYSGRHTKCARLLALAEVHSWHQIHAPIAQTLTVDAIGNET